jgi:Mitochondrial carrier protein
MFRVNQAWQNFLRRLASGFFVGATTVGLSYPLEVLQVKNMLDMTAKRTEPKFKGIIDTIRKVTVVEGVFSFYRGFLISVLGIGPYLGLSFAFYEGIKSMINQNRLKSGGYTMELISFLGIGTAAGVMAHIVTYPLDTIRRQQQASGSLVSKAVKARGILETARRIREQQGIKGFYGGLGVSCFRAGPAACIQFVSYHMLRSTLDNL